MKKIKLLILGIITGLVSIVTLASGCVAPEGGEGEGTSGLYMILFLVVLFAFFYFVMIRPQRKKQKEHQQMTQQLKRGDKIVTIGGIYGQIESVSDDSLVIKVESGATIRIARSGVAGVRTQEKEGTGIKFR